MIKTSIKYKIALWAGVCLVFMAILLVGFSVVFLRSEAEEAARVQGLAAAQTQAALVKDYFDSELAAMRSAAKTISIMSRNRAENADIRVVA